MYGESFRLRFWTFLSEKSRKAVVRSEKKVNFFSSVDSLPRLVRRFGKRGNTLSCSYTDVNKNPDRRLGTNLEMMTEHKKEPYIVYGWDHVRPGSVMEVANTDLNTPQIISKKGYISLSESELDIWDKLENDTAKVKGSYNEVAMRRYNENGDPQAPDYLVIEDGKISEAIKHHADTFGVPILNVERRYYDKKLGESLEADGALESEKIIILTENITEIEESLLFSGVIGGKTAERFEYEINDRIG